MVLCEELAAEPAQVIDAGQQGCAADGQQVVAVCDLAMRAQRTRAGVGRLCLRLWGMGVAQSTSLVVPVQMHPL